MQIKTPCCKLYLQQGAEKQIEQLSVSFIRTIPSALESHQISTCYKQVVAGYTAGGESHPAPKNFLFLPTVINHLPKDCKPYFSNTFLSPLQYTENRRGARVRPFAPLLTHNLTIPDRPKALRRPPICENHQLPVFCICL